MSLRLRVTERTPCGVDVFLRLPPRAFGVRLFLARESEGGFGFLDRGVALSCLRGQFAFACPRRGGSFLRFGAGAGRILARLGRLARLKPRATSVFRVRSNTARASQYTWLTAQGTLVGFFSCLTRLFSSPLSSDASSARAGVNSSRGRR